MRPVKGANADTPGNVKKINHDFEETNLAFTHLTIWSTRLKYQYVYFEFLFFATTFHFS